MEIRPLDRFEAKIVVGKWKVEPDHQKPIREFLCTLKPRFNDVMSDMETLRRTHNLTDGEMQVVQQGFGKACKYTKHIDIIVERGEN